MAGHQILCYNIDMSKELGGGKKDLGNKLFEFGKKLDNIAIAAGIGIAAVGSVLAAPAVAAFGAVTIGASVAGKEITNRLQEGYNKLSIRRSLGAAATKQTAQSKKTLAA